MATGGDFEFHGGSASEMKEHVSKHNKD